MIKSALLLIAHGSRQNSANLEIIQLKNKISKLVDTKKEKFSIVEIAFLELATPSIPQGIKNCIKKGANQVVVFPYFLTKGKHVVEDIPNIVSVQKKIYPNIKIKTIKYFGLIPNIEKHIHNFVS